VLGAATEEGAIAVHLIIICPLNVAYFIGNEI
jgi:hypothetical protein